MKKRSTRKLRKRGGAKIGEGSYGFVVKPAIPCVGRNVSRKVSKVFKKKENLSANKRNHYRNFANRKASLEPVIKKLQEIDPDQDYFLYPELCDTPGNLTNNLRANGITNNTKGNSYLMNPGGQSYDELMGDIQEMLNRYFYSIATIKEVGESNDEDEINEKKKVYDKFYNLVKPIAEKTYKAMEKLHNAGILHRDMHTGNILLELDDKARDFFKKANALLKSVNYNRKTFYKPSAAQKAAISKFLDAVEGNELSDVKVRLIDFDSAQILDNLNTNSDEALDDRGEVIYMIFLVDSMVGRFYDEL